MRRNPSDMPADYWPNFVRYHLELPWYYARSTDCRVHLTTTEPVEYSENFQESGGGTISTLTEGQFNSPFFKEEHQPYDLVIHWRKWYDELYTLGARNVIVLQDHTYSDQWKSDVARAYNAGKLDGLMVFPLWHKENVIRELEGIIPPERMYEGLSLAVDTDVYCPEEKDPYSLLWASDPGRGLSSLIEPFMRLWQKDRRFKLTVTYPDYVTSQALGQYSSFLRHPGVKNLGCIPNGPQLRSLFNTAAVLPYTSVFREPFGRCPMQALSAGSLVLYPPDMGTPSRLIENGVSGFVEPIERWPELIASTVTSDRMKLIGDGARRLALANDWRVQAQRFYEFFMKDVQ
jgi:glycosyltransferase involved in cell wall biosynthesis